MRHQWMRKTILACILVLNSLIWAGFQGTDFYYYRYTKETWYHTYHRTIQIPVLDNYQSNRWFGMPFTSGNMQSITYAAYPNGKQIIMGVHRSSSLMYLTNDQQIGSIFGGAPEVPVYDKSSCIQNLASDENGNFYFSEPCNQNLVHVRIDINNPTNRNYKNISLDYIPAGVTAISDGIVQKCAAIGTDGKIRIYNPTLDSSITISTPDSAWAILKFKSDGKLDSLGRAVFWVYLWNKSFYIQELHVDLTKKTTAARTSILHINPNDTVPNGTNPLNVWYDFIPFAVGPNQVRIVAVNFGQLHVFSSDGAWIETPAGDAFSNNICPVKCPSLNNFSLSGYLQLATLNNSKNWQTRQEILLSDNFDQPGHGFHRLNWVPDGYEDYFAIDVKMKELSSPTDPISKPLIRITNTSPVRQLTNAKLRLWLSREENPKDSIVADRYYLKDDSSRIETGCSLKNPNLCWVDIIFSNYWTLNPLDSTGQQDIQIGLHYASWKSWIKANDPTWKSVGSNFTSVQNIALYTDQAQTGDWKLSWGKEVSPDSVKLPFGYVANDTNNIPIDHGPSLIQGFENSNGWVSDNAKLKVDSSIFFDGHASLSILNPEWTTITSLPFSTQGSFTKIAIQFMQPKPPINPYWPGQVQVSISIPSKNIFNCWLGQFALLNQPEAVWLDITNGLPSQVTAALQSGAKDVQVSISLNAPTASGVFHIDNLRFTN